MTFEQIKELHDMGFTPEQITELNKLPIPSSETIPDGGSAGDGNGTENAPAPAITEDQATPAAAPAEVGGTNSDPKEVGGTNSDLIKEIRELKASIQASNIKTISVDNVQPENTLENVMAEFIRPTYKEKEDT